MSNRIIKTKCDILHNKAYFHLNPFEEPRYREAVCERLLHLGELLSENDFLGLQLYVSDERKWSGFAFSGGGIKVTSDDFQWIFQKAAKVRSILPADFDDLFKWNKKVYTLQYKPPIGKKNAKDEGPVLYDEIPNYYFNEMLSMFEDGDAAIRIIIGANSYGNSGRGMILLSLSEDLTLCMRNAISLAFPHTVVKELHKRDLSEGYIRQLPAKFMKKGIYGILQGLLNRGGIEWDEDEDENEGYMEKYIEPEEKENSSNFTPIDELGLPIRCYYCLKRAGINSVERLRELSDEDFQNIPHLGTRLIERIKQKLSEIKHLPVSGQSSILEQSPPPEQASISEQSPSPEQASMSEQSSTPDYFAMLDGLIGLKEVKEQVRKIAAFAKMKQDIFMQRKKLFPVVLHMEFVGNPGTAKTTVARLIAGILNEVGILSYNELVEVGRADLVANYTGQTASKVKEVFKRAKGKLLFIDEAYSLAEYDTGSFGDEAINTIVQEMENNRGDTIVVFAGYPDKMEQFFSRNSGLRSRVPFTIRFMDYSADEMVKIVEIEARKRGFTIGSQAKGKVFEICETVRGNPDAGNGRFCRNLVESAVLSYALRVYGKDTENLCKDFVLIEEDFMTPDSLQNIKKDILMGFHV